MPAIPRMVRDLSRDLAKKVGLDLDGGDVEMDREMIEMVVDPLTHIVRNALDHGIEPPADRLAAGKPETGALRVIARQSGNQIVIEIADDGRGINRAALLDKAVKNGLLNASEAAALTDEEKLHLIFHPGLSTAQAVTAVSGRGVGMDVVRANIEQIGGVIGVESVAGEGTTITMRVPLTLTIIPGLIVRSGGHYYAMPRGNVVELLHQNSAMVAIEEVGGARIATIRGEAYSLVDIEDVLGLTRTAMRGPRTLMVIRSSLGQPYVLGVEQVESNEELVIRPASPLVTAAGVFAGMTLPDNGQPMLLLDAAGIAQAARLPLREAQRGPMAGTLAAQGAAREETEQALVFAERDGTRRLIPLAIVDRVEDLFPSQVATSNGRAFARIEGKLYPALNAAEGVTDAVKSLRLHAGQETLCYLISDVLDIIDVPPRLSAVLNAGRIAGLVMVGTRQMEMIDPFALFAEAAREAAGAGIMARSVHCLIADADDAWLSGILAPLLRQAGHIVSLGATTDRAPDIILCSDMARPRRNGRRACAHAERRRRGRRRRRGHRLSLRPRRHHRDDHRTGRAEGRMTDNLFLFADRRRHARGGAGQRDRGRGPPGRHRADPARARPCPRARGAAQPGPHRDRHRIAHLRPRHVDRRAPAGRGLGDRGAHLWPAGRDRKRHLRGERRHPAHPGPHRPLLGALRDDAGRARGPQPSAAQPRRLRQHADGCVEGCLIFTDPLRTAGRTAN